MSDHIENAGKKGYCLMYFFIAFFLFIITWASIYYSNFTFNFGN
jgi:hypothetical protein